MFFSPVRFRGRARTGFELGPPEPPDEGFASLTHARLRARQGDYRGAARVLRELLERDPDRQEAQQLLRRIGRLADTGQSPKPQEPAVSPPTPAEAGRLAGRFRKALGGPDPRVRRLERWLGKIRRGG